MRIAVALTFVVVAILGGCSTSATHHDVDFDGTIEVENNQFVMDGNVSLGQGAAPDATFENVTVVLYDANKTVIKRIPVGNLSTTPPPLSQRINITTDTIPTYVVIDSPDFWQSDTTVYVNGYKRPDDGGRYEEYSRASASEKFPDD
jgi:hypothetical protein